MRHNWAHNRGKDDGTATCTYTGQGAWLRATPGSATTTISNEAFRLNTAHWMGINAPGAGQPRRRALRLGQGPTCQGWLDGLGVHAAACARHTNRHRHDELRDHLAQTEYARTAGITATIEQANTTWVDAMITAAPPARPITESLRGAAAHKCREYGLGVPNTALLHQGLVPFVMEQHGCPGALRTNPGRLPHLQESPAPGEHARVGYGRCQEASCPELLDDGVLHAGESGISQLIGMPGLPGT